MAVPMLDAPLADWSANFQVVGSAAPLDFQLTAEEMTQYTTLQSAFIAANTLAKADGSRSKALVQAKNDAKAELLTYSRELYGSIQSSGLVTNENKVLIGVTVRKTIPTPTPPPAIAPLVTVLSIVGRTVRGKLADATAPTKRRRPFNASGATIMSFAGATPPPAGDPSWKLEGQTGKTTFLVRFGNDVVTTSPCWISVVWYNKRGQYSPACAPVQVYLQAGPATLVA